MDHQHVTPEADEDMAWLLAHKQSRSFKFGCLGWIKRVVPL